MQPPPLSPSPRAEAGGPRREMGRKVGAWALPGAQPGCRDFGTEGRAEKPSLHSGGKVSHKRCPGARARNAASPAANEDKAPYSPAPPPPTSSRLACVTRTALELGTPLVVPATAGSAHCPAPSRARGYPAPELSAAAGALQAELRTIRSRHRRQQLAFHYHPAVRYGAET